MRRGGTTTTTTRNDDDDIDDLYDDATMETYTYYKFGTTSEDTINKYSNKTQVLLFSTHQKPGIFYLFLTQNVNTVNGSK